MSVEEHTIELAGSPVFMRRVGSGVPAVLLVHGLPTSSADLVAFLERAGGIAPDLPGFGRSGKGGHLDYSLNGHTNFLETLLAAHGADRVSVVAHGWGGAVALVFAQRHPERVERLALIDPVPLIAGVRWPRFVEWWRRPILGELLMGSTSRRALARTLRAGAASPDAFSATELKRIWEDFDQGTQRALLRAHRATDPEQLAQTGHALSSLSIPALIVWGERDPWLPVELGRRLAGTLPNAELDVVPDAGHWPWRVAPSVVGRVAEFIGPRQ